VDAADPVTTIAAQPAATSSTSTAPTTTQPRDPDPPPQIQTVGEDLDRIFRELFELGQWRLRNPDRVPDAELTPALAELRRCGERLRESVATVGDVEI
jgi:hypothetical protein